MRALSALEHTGAGGMHVGLMKCRAFFEKLPDDVSLYDLFHFEKIQRMIEIGDIEIAPLAFMR